MKKIISLLIAVLITASGILVLSSCDKEAKNPVELVEESVKEKVDLTEILLKIDESVEMSGDMMTLTADDLIDYYGIESSDVVSCAVSQDMCGYLDEIIMIEAVDETAAANIETALNDYLEYKKEEMRTYLPEQYEVLNNCSVNVNGLFVSLFISSSADEINEIYEGYVK